MNSSALWSGGNEPSTRGASRPTGADKPAAAQARVVQPPVRPTLVGRVRHRLGWRLYALPILIAATVLLIIDIGRVPSTTATPEAAGSTGAAAPGSAGTSSDAAPESAQSPTTVSPTSTAAATAAASEPAVDTAATGATSVPGPDPEATLSSNLAVGALPAGDPFDAAGDGSYRVVPGAGPQIGTAGTVVTYSIEIENGVTPPGGDAEFAAFVDQTLADPRSWSSVKGISLQRLDAPDANPEFRITLTSQQTVRGICGFSVPLESSCYSGQFGRVVINDARWVRGALSYAGDLNSYRQYAVNHEVGHALGYGHQPCGSNGGLAPVMMQQSWSTSNDALAGINGSVDGDGKVCLPNPWPDPAGAEGEATVATG